MNKHYTVVSGALFGLIAIAQAVRAVLQLPVKIGDFEVPVLASWVAAVAAATLGVWAFKERK